MNPLSDSTDLSTVPLSTYRLGFHKGFRLSQALPLLSYLESLGITTLYASPLFSSRSGSLHGYDVTDPTRLNPEIGTTGDMERLHAGLSSRHMGLILDIVPNHMAAHFENPWWRDLLENGESSPFSMFFDVDWDPPQRVLKNRISLPVLGATYGKTLENREFELAFGKNGFVLKYWDSLFPIDPGTLGPVLSLIFSCLEGDPREEAAKARAEIDGVIQAVSRFPPRSLHSVEKHRRVWASRGIRKSLRALFRENSVFRDVLEKALQEYRGIRGIPSSFDRMDQLLNAQVYWLSHWKTVTRTLNYRRFFDVADLVGVRAGDERVFEAFHRLVEDWARKGWIDGVRVDHVDGLKDPSEYLVRLAGLLRESRPERFPRIWVEKILGNGESLPPDWPVLGTTGYEFANQVIGILGSPEGVLQLRARYEEKIDPEARFREIVYQQKKHITEALLGGELRRLTLMFEHLAQEDRMIRETGFRELQTALVELTACLDVYRTYIREQTIREEDRRRIFDALSEARKRHPNRRQGLYRFFERTLTLDFPPDLPPDRRKRWVDFVKKWQQFTGPAMAKGVEDTAFYLYSPLISANEVGGNPALPPPSSAGFHRFNRERLEKFPLALSATSTHDTKRSEDVRTRIQAISEHAGEWIERFGLWRKWNRKARGINRGPGKGAIPDPPLENFLYQTMAGAWPLDPGDIPCFSERLSSYLVKVARESKLHTNWISPDTDYEEALCAFAREICRTERKNPFLRNFLEFQSRIAQEGACLSLSQLILKMASPGVCDFYQGNELWDLSLVDPDNRRPVDFGHRIRLLAGLRNDRDRDPFGLFDTLLDNWKDGRIKMFAVQTLLSLRKLHPDLFLLGKYRPLLPEWEERHHMAGFVRATPGKELLVAVFLRIDGRLETASLRAREGLFRGIYLPLPVEDDGRKWRNVFTGRDTAARISKNVPELPMEEAMENAPFAVFLRVR